MVKQAEVCVPLWNILWGGTVLHGNACTTRVPQGAVYISCNSISVSPCAVNGLVAQYYIYAEIYIDVFFAKIAVAQRL